MFHVKNSVSVLISFDIHIIPQRAGNVLRKMTAKNGKRDAKSVFIFRPEL